MNTSRRTCVIAQGVYLYACVQDLPTNDARNPTVAHQEWNLWCQLWPNYVEFVKREQFNLFDRVNGAF